MQEQMLSDLETDLKTTEPSPESGSPAGAREDQLRADRRAADRRAANRRAADRRAANQRAADQRAEEIATPSTMRSRNTGALDLGLNSQSPSATGSSGTSLRSRLLQTILPVVLLPLIAASSLGYYLIAQRTERRIQQQLSDQALLTSEGTTAVLNELLDLPRSMADSPLVVNEAKAGSQKAIESGLDDRPIELLEADFAGSKLLRQHNALNTYLEKTVETAEISELSVTESHGFNVASSHPTTDFVQSDETWWQNSKANQQWIGPPDFDFASKGFTVELAQAIRDPQDDSFVGVIRAVVPTRKFSLMAGYLKRTGISGSQRVQLIDGGTLKTIDTFSAQGFRKEREIIGGQPVEQMITAFAAATQGQSSADQVLAALKSKADKVSLPLFDETAKVVSFTSQNRQYKVAKIPNSNWVAIASMDESEISAAGRDSLLFLALFTLLLGGLTTALIFWLSRQLSAPLGRLTQQAEELAAGNFDIAVAPAGTVETRFLTQTFNQLAVQVKGLLSDQRTETQKAQLFAYMTGSPVMALSDIEPVIEMSLQRALDILKADRVAFYQVATDSVGGNTASRIASRILLRSHMPDFHSAEEAFNPADWLPTNSSSGASPDDFLLDQNLNEFLCDLDQRSDQAIVFNDIAAAEVDDRHREFLKAMTVQSSLSVPVFSETEANNTKGETNGETTCETTIWGYLIVHHCREAHVWQADEIGFVQQLAAQLKLVVDRITATENMRRSRFETQASQQVAQQSQQQAAALNRQQQQQKVEYRRQEESLQQQITALAREIEGVSQGDLTVRAQVSEGKLKSVASVFNATIGKLEELVTQIQQSTHQVDTVFDQNEQAATALTEVAHQQTQQAMRTLETVHAAYESMNSVVDIANEASKSARQVAEKAEAGEVAIQQTSEKIQALNNTANSAVIQIGQLVRSAHNVSYMTAMISEIAAEMKLIASQNAGAEGHREESSAEAETSRAMGAIAKLSERAVSEASIIDTFLTSAQRTSEQIAQAMAQLNEQVTDSNQSMLNSQQNLSEVLAIAKQFERVAQSVSLAAQTQPQVTQTATELLESAASLSATTSQVSEEMAESLQKAIETTRQLQHSVSVFKVSH
jgi:methyl-accepting chemotaxis protein PixJ